MKVTNISGGAQRVRGIDGVEEIQPGRSRRMTFTDEQLAKISNRPGIKIEPEIVAAPPVNVAGFVAKHRGGGSYWILDAAGEEIASGLSKAEAEEFNAMSEEDKATVVAKAD